MHGEEYPNYLKFGWIASLPIQLMINYLRPHIIIKRAIDMTKAILIVLTIVVIIIYSTTDLLEQGYQYTNNLISSGTKQQVTYYQWTDNKGEMIVSRIKPDPEIEYIIFQASEDLMLSENNVDQALINKGNDYRASMSQQSQKNKVSGSTIGGSTTSMYPFNAISKTKKCVKLSGQIADANRQQNKSKLMKLRQQHSKECG